MERQIELPLGSAGVLAEAGMQRAADHADAVVPSWTDMAAALICGYLQRMPAGHAFTAQGIHRSDFGMRLPPPPDKRAWGSVMRRLSKEGVIKSEGFVKSDSPSGHGHPVSRWVKL